MLCAENVFTNLHLTEFYICRIVHRENCDMCRNLHLCFCAQCRFVISAFGKIFALQICAFLCTTVFRTFAHLHICVLHLCAEVLHMWKSFCASCEFVKMFSGMCANMQKWFWAFFTEFANLSVFCKNDEKVEISENVPKMSEKSSRVSWVVHEWFLGQRVWQHRVAKVARICIN